MPLMDVTPYRKYVDHYDLTEEQKVELIHAVWNIMETYADKAFGNHPVQQCTKMKNTNRLHEPKRPILSLVERQRSGVSKLRK